jgi:hypothetical protein
LNSVKYFWEASPDKVADLSKPSEDMKKLSSNSQEDLNEALTIAALGYNIERAVGERKVRRGDYESCDEFKNSNPRICKGLWISLTTRTRNFEP